VSDFLQISTKISDLKCCVIIPTYNNEKTLKEVIEGVLLYTKNIIVVNDGSSDNTSEILKEFPHLIQIHFAKNKGKGIALRKGFIKAIEEGYHYAITIDSDGQHYPDDIPVFIDELENDRKVLLIGSRNMKHDSVPKNSSFGNSFSNFWFWAETGIKLTDSQSGFRLYPLEIIDKIKFYTSKFEFEIESIVRVAWRGFDVRNVPIKVLYNEERVSHFRPITDFVRISILNTWLILVALFYIKPRNFLLKIKRKGLKRFFLENFLNNSDSPEKKALSISLGVFIGIIPIWGFQTILVISLAAAFKLNKVISFAFSNVSIPPFIPIIVYNSMIIGGWVFGTEINIDLENLSNNINLLTNVKEYILGSFILASVASLTIGLMGFIILKLIERKRE